MIVDGRIVIEVGAVATGVAGVRAGFTVVSLTGVVIGAGAAAVMRMVGELAPPGSTAMPSIPKSGCTPAPTGSR